MADTKTEIFINDIVRVSYPGTSWDGEVCLITMRKKGEGEELEYNVLTLGTGRDGYGIPHSRLEVLCTGQWLQENRHKFAEEVIIQRVRMPDDMGVDTTIHRTMAGANKTFRTTIGLYEEYDQSDFRRSTSTVPLLD